jgi:hypothetical protein
VKPGIREDDVLIDVWDACSRFDRPQDVFRTMLRRGMIAMVESGDMPKAVIDACGLDAIVDSIIERRRRKSGRGRQETQEPVPQYPQPYPTQPPYGSYPPQPPYAPYPPQGYAGQPDPNHWGQGHERPPRQQDYGYDRAAPEPMRPTSDSNRSQTIDRRAIEEKLPSETPKPTETPMPEKRTDPAPKPVAFTATGKKLGDLM